LAEWLKVKAISSSPSTAKKEEEEISQSMRNNVASKTLGSLIFP
jgi:hypothetical protein